MTTRTPADDTPRQAFAARLAAEPGVHDHQVVAALAAGHRDRLIPAAFVPADTGPRPTKWSTLTADTDPARHQELVWGMDQVVVELAGLAAESATPRTVHQGRPTAQSSGAGLVALALQDLQPLAGTRLLELGTCTGWLAAAGAALTGRQVTGIEAQPEIARRTTMRLAAIGADVRIVAGDALRLGFGGPARPWNRIAASFAVPSLPKPWLDALAEGGRMTATLSQGAPGWHLNALVERDGAGRLAGTVSAGLWGHVPARGVDWLPVPDRPAGAGMSRSAVLAPPHFGERGFWTLLGLSLPGVRRHWSPGDDTVVLVGSADGSRAHVAPDGSTATCWGPTDLWALAEHLHERWTSAGRASSPWTSPGSTRSSTPVPRSDGPSACPHPGTRQAVPMPSDQANSDAPTQGPVRADGPPHGR
ncbi:hypothetical protein [Kitasatospora sp. NPDC092286]|uniref:hypothetical protein n=1 Tax=Kitasatospora sp. NPDC092286 TaxID=3364087 RepID=UPI0037F2B61D